MRKKDWADDLAEAYGEELFEREDLDIGDIVTDVAELLRRTIGQDRTRLRELVERWREHAKTFPRGGSDLLYAVARELEEVIGKGRDDE